MLESPRTSAAQVAPFLSTLALPADFPGLAEPCSALQAECTISTQCATSASAIPPAGPRWSGLCEQLPAALVALPCCLWPSNESSEGPSRTSKIAASAFLQLLINSPKLVLQTEAQHGGSLVATLWNGGRGVEEGRGQEMLHRHCSSCFPPS